MIKLNNKGFSFIEVIIYIAIVSILLTAVVSLHLTLGGTSSKLTSNVLASRNRRVALGTVDYLIENSDGFLKDVYGDCSDFSTNPPSLALYFTDDTYLPGTCVDGGGGVEISVVNDKLALTCYPNIPGNGYYDACNTTTYPAGNVYYITSSDVSVLDSSLIFSTSTSSSTANNFLTVTTKLSVSSLSSNQSRLSATSTATSTIVFRNNEASGLVGFWRLGEDSGCNDTVGPNDLFYYGGTGVSGLVNGSDNAIDFEISNPSTEACVLGGNTGLGFSDEFTIAAWVKEDSSGTDRQIFGLSDLAYQNANFYINNGYPMLRIGDDVSNTDYTNSNTLMSNGTVYHVAATYDLNDDEINIYLYQKGVGGKPTSTANSIATVAVQDAAIVLSYEGGDTGFDGVIDEVRVYNRALTPEEIVALRSQGE